MYRGCTGMVDVLGVARVRRASKPMSAARPQINAAPFLLRRVELARLERERAGGVTSREVVGVFQARGARLSAATFRKYVQLGLLPRSRRIGRKGKHTGSKGLYPVAVLRRIDLIKRMMAEGLTLEDVRES